MNILYIGHYRENSSFGFAARQYIEAMRSSKQVNLSIRPIFMQKDRIYSVPEYYAELEDNHSKFYDIIIQDTLPNFYEYNAKFGKNICIPKIETRNLSHTGWIDKINMMDEVWVNSFFGEKSLRESGVTKTIKVVPIPFDIDSIEQAITDKEDNEFNFYTITSSKEKDGLLKLLMAYFLEFDDTDNARIIIKTNEEKELDIQNIITQAYNYSRINHNKVKEPVIINGNINNAQMTDLHNNSDCYIDASKASYAGMCCIQAALHQNICICTDSIAPSSYITKQNGFVVSSTESNCISNPVYGISNIYTPREKWYEPSLESLMVNMRQAYQLSAPEKENKIKQFNKNIFSHKNFTNYL